MNVQALNIPTQFEPVFARMVLFAKQFERRAIFRDPKGDGGRPLTAEELIRDAVFQFQNQTPKFDPAKGTILEWVQQRMREYYDNSTAPRARTNAGNPEANDTQVETGPIKAKAGTETRFS